MQYRFDTNSIHAQSEDDQHQALQMPLYLNSTFSFTDIEQADNTFSFKRQAYVYTRGGNPTINLFERRIAVLEHGAGSVAFASGMAAVTGVLLSLVKQNDVILAHRNLYGSTYAAMTKIMPNFGITTNFVNMTKLNEVQNAINKNVKVIFLESPTNPSLEIIDIQEIVALAKRFNIKVVVDNTFASPCFQNPLVLGADVVVHSATKYIGGHGDIIAGVAISNDLDYLAELKFGILCELGAVLSPFSAWLALRGMKTLGVRMQKHQETATRLADFLSSHSKVTKVLYPGLSSHSGHEVARKQMSGFGGVVSFEIAGDAKDAVRCVESLKIPKIAVSLGDTETLVQIPALMTHRSYPKERLHEFGFSESTIRISTGLEDSSDIIEDLQVALDNI